MTTVINNPGGEKSGGVGIIVGIIVLIIVAALFFIYVLPIIRNSGDGGGENIDINVKLPTGDGGNSAPSY